MADEDDSPVAAVGADEVRLSPEEELLRQASVTLRTLSADCLLHLARVPEGGHFEECALEPGEELALEGGCLTILLRGSLRLESAPGAEQVLRSPAVVGEADFLGIAQLPPSAPTRAQALEGCEVRRLRREAFQSVLKLHPEDAKAFDRLSREASVLAAPGEQFARMDMSAGRRLLAFLQAGPIFESCDKGFIANLWSRAEGVLLAPGDRLEDPGALYVVLAGRLQVEGPSGVLLRFAGPGEVLGAAAALGAEEQEAWPEQLRAMEGRTGPAFCAKLPGKVLASVLHDYPEELVALQEAASRAQEAERASAEQRCQWLQEVAVPALAQTSLLAGCPEEFLQAVAGSLSETTHAEGAQIIACGDTADSMLVLLEGVVGLESKSGKEIGCLGPGGVLGEPEALGLLQHRTVTAHAVSDCRMLAVSAEALSRALSAPSASALKEGFRQLVEGRRKQVTDGLPLTALLNLRTSLEEDVGAHLLALRAERLPLEPGVRWEPAPDSDESGPRLSVIVRGRVALEVNEDRQQDVSVKPGTVLPEGLLATYAGRLRAVSSDCEVYRIRQFDLLQAAHTTPQAPDWFYQLRILEREGRSWLQTRLSNARGLALGKTPHPIDERIRGWAEKKKKDMRRAKEKHEHDRENYLGSKLPLLPHNRLGSTSFRSWPAPTGAPLGKPLAKQLGSGYPAAQGPEAFRALRLSKAPPRARSEPQLPKLPKADKPKGTKLPPLQLRQRSQQALKADSSRRVPSKSSRGGSQVGHAEAVEDDWGLF